LDVERAAALPVLVSLRPKPRARCAGQRGYVVSGPHARARVLAACEHRFTLGTYTMAESGGEVAVSRCDTLTGRDR
jgi:hypothetical protein